MADLENLYYPLENVESGFEVKGSEFLSYLVGINNFLEFVSNMRQSHPKAVHFVTASRFLNSQKQIEESFSDDGEPKGTSGMPTLKVMRGFGLIECGILIVRYFGGTLLGTGGLVRAYTKAAKDVALKAREQNKLERFIQRESAQIIIGFHLFSQVEYLAKKGGIQITNKEFVANGVELTLSAKGECLGEFLRTIEAL